MDYEVLEISWLVTALVFAFSQGSAALLISCAPKGDDEGNIDRAIEYFELVLRPLNAIMGVGFLALFFAVALSWLYFLNIDSIGKYEAPIAITVFSIAVYILLNRILSRILVSHLRPESPNSS